jgi:hypothetical protein
MKFQSLLIYFLTVTVLTASMCKKKPVDPIDQLPSATQTGANTFGCLVNGKVWVPKGYDGTGTPNPHIKMETGLNGLPVLTIDTHQIINQNTEGTVFLSIGNLLQAANFNYPSDMNFLFGWSKYFGNCGTPAFDTTIQKWGGGIITKLDLPNHIISGTFYCKFKAPQCDTVFLTDGRFDIKF